MLVAGEITRPAGTGAWQMWGRHPPPAPKAFSAKFNPTLLWMG